MRSVAYALMTLSAGALFSAPASAGCGEQFAVFRHVPSVVQPGCLEGRVECHPMAVALGVSQRPVHVEDDSPQRVHVLGCRRIGVTTCRGGGVWRLRYRHGPQARRVRRALASLSRVVTSGISKLAR